jgi:hypothetical protein
VLFAGAGLSHSSFLRVLAYSGAAVFVVLITADIAGSFVDGHSFPDRTKHAAHVLTLPMLSVRALFSVVLGLIYSSLIFAGVGPWTPFIFLPVIFIVCCFVGWRNVSLWYQQGEEFEEALAAEQNQHSRLPQIPNHRAQ